MTNNGEDDDLLIKPNELKKKIDKGEDIFILDVRDHEEHKSWKISYDKHQDSDSDSHNDLSLPSINRADSKRRRNCCLLRSRK